MITHLETLSVALEAAHLVGLPPDRVLLIDCSPQSRQPGLPDLVSFGLKQPQVFTERRLRHGEAKTKLALLLLSSGTTGKPKVSVQRNTRMYRLPPFTTRTRQL